MLGCHCGTCTSSDARDQRDRSSIMLTAGGRHVVVDTTPEFRYQMLRAQVDDIEAVLLTHHHADHIHGLDDLRQFTLKSGRTIPVYGPPESMSWVKEHFSYIWNAPQVGGGLPKVEMAAIEGCFSVAGIRLRPIPVKHGVMNMYGYRTGNFAYISDVSEIPPASWDLLTGLDVLVIDAVRRKPHKTHFCVDAAVETARKLEVKQTYLTHLSHHLRHEDLVAELPDGIEPAYDGLSFRIQADCA